MPRFLVGITHQVYRHRVFAIAGAITALFLMLLAVLPALFASDPKLSNAVPAYSEVSEEVVDALVHSSSLPLLVAAIIFSIWGVSVYLRCLDYVLRRRLVAIAAICALWMIEVILKYKSFTPFYATVLWYLYYVPMTLIPLLYQLCGLRLAGLEQHRLGRRYCAALWIVAILLIGFVLTNDFHQQVFCFDRTSDTWSNDYTYGWGYFAVLVWTAFDFVAFLSWSVGPRPFASSVSRARRRSYCWVAHSLPSRMLCACPGHGGSTSRSSIASCAWWRWKSVSIAVSFRHITTSPASSTPCRLTSKF